MLSPAIRMAGDYNRGLIAPVRWAHVVAAAVFATWRATFGNSWWGRLIVWPIVLGAAAFVLIHPFDAAIGEQASRVAAKLSGDLRRELLAWQQYGQGVALLLAAAAIWLLEPPRRRRLLDLLIAAGLAQLVAQGGKMLIGRPRPRPWFNDPTTFLGPWGEYPIHLKDGTEKLVHAWDTRAGATTDLWSMPSSHTMFAVVLSVFLAAMYPRLKPLLVAMVILVAVCRVLFDAHWATDVVIGAAAGYAASAPAVQRYWGVRLVDWLWRTVVDRNAIPALPATIDAERVAIRH